MKQVKVITWNIWGGANIDDIIECLRVADADIVGLQEVLEETDGSKNNAENIAKALGYEWIYTPTRVLDPEHSHLLKTHGYTREMRWGNAVLSRQPIIENSTYILSEHKSRTAIMGNIMIGDKKLAVVSTHLVHSEDSELMRNTQVDALLKIVPNERTIVMGDFNASPTSVAIEKMRQRFIDTQENSRSDLVQPAGVETVDYIFISKEIECINSGVIHSDASDHLPIFVNIKL